MKERRKSKQDGNGKKSKKSTNAKLRRQVINYSKLGGGGKTRSRSRT